MERSTSNLKHLILYHAILNNFVWPGLHFSEIYIKTTYCGLGISKYETFYDKPC